MLWTLPALPTLASFVYLVQGDFHLHVREQPFWMIVDGIPFHLLLFERRLGYECEGKMSQLS